MKKITAILLTILMTGMLLLLMAYQVTGEKLHEWIGVFMFLLFIMHNILNIRWYGNFYEKLLPDAAMGKALPVHYSGGNSLPEDVSSWLKENGIIE